MTVTSILKSPLRYPGGKQRLVQRLVDFLPSSRIHEYREPFLGGGSLFLFLVQHKTEIEKWRVNDLFFPCANFWQECQRDPEGLIERVEAFRSRFPDDGRGLHSLLRKGFEELSTNQEKAAAFFILNRISFSGLTFSGGYSEAAFLGRLKDSHVRTLASVAILLKRKTGSLVIRNVDYREELLEGDRHTFVFMDPPYQIDSSTLYGNSGKLHQEFDHEQFAEACRNASHLKWMITYNDSPKIRELFSPFANIHEIAAKYSMNSVAKEKKELVITNY